MLHALFLFWIAISHLYSFLLEPVLASHTTICLHKILFRSIRSTSGEIVMATIYHIFNYPSGNQYHHLHECKAQRQRLVKQHKDVTSKKIASTLSFHQKVFIAKNSFLIVALNPCESNICNFYTFAVDNFCWLIYISNILEQYF